MDDEREPTGRIPEVVNAYAAAMRVVLSGGLCSLLYLDGDLYIAVGVCGSHELAERILSPDIMVRAGMAVEMAVAHRESIEGLIGG